MRERGRELKQKQLKEMEEAREAAKNSEPAAGGKREMQREETRKLQEAGRKLMDELLLKGASKKEALRELKNQLGSNPGRWNTWEYRGEI